MFSGPGHSSVAATVGLCTDYRPHLLVTKYTDWVRFFFILFEYN